MIHSGANASEVSMGTCNRFVLFEDLNIFLKKKILSSLINLTTLFFIDNIEVNFISNLLDLSQILSIYMH